MEKIMKLFKKVTYLDGSRKLYFCGIKIWSFYEPVGLPDFKLDIKKFLAVKNCKNLKNLVLGSSHGRDCFIPGKYDFNLSGSSLDMYRIWKLYSWVVKNNGKKLKNIIIVWSVFHAGLQLEKTKEYPRCISYKALYKINYALPLPMNDAVGLKSVKEQSEIASCPKDYRGQASYTGKHFYEPAKVLVKKHLKNTNRDNNQIQYLQKIVDAAKKHKHKVFVVLPPYRSDYLKYLPNDEIVYRELFDFVAKNKDVKLLNFQHDKDFKYSDFDSSDHCNEIGAIKMTKKLNKAIRKYE
jgi:hypothetical protein